MKAKNNNRVWELDFLKGIALMLMIYFHIVYDLSEYYNVNISYSIGLNFYIGRISAILFMILSGISCSLAKSNIVRGLKLFLLALIITAVTTIAGPDYSIKFGILHLLGLSIILYELIKGLNKYYIISLSALIIFIGNIFSQMTVKSNFLFPLGLANSGFYSADYYPILPWSGVFLIGAFIGKVFYKNREGYIKHISHHNPINLIGQKTLIIYLIHQPIILFILTIIYK